jgi:hypothetical protein
VFCGFFTGVVEGRFYRGILRFVVFFCGGLLVSCGDSCGGCGGFTVVILKGGSTTGFWNLFFGWGSPVVVRAVVLGCNGDNKGQATAKTTATADPYGMTNKRTNNSNGNGKDNSRSLRDDKQKGQTKGQTKDRQMQRQRRLQ